jgi:type IV pilus assembly protein PilX
LLLRNSAIVSFKPAREQSIMSIPVHSAYGRSHQQGAALIVSLILIAVMTTFGLLGVRLISGQERQAGQTYDRTLSFQAAEAALRQAEVALDQIEPEPTGTVCTDMTNAGYTVRVCPVPSASATPRWLDSGFTSWANGAVVGTGTLALTPQYFVEHLGSTFPCGLDPSDPPACKRYRITSRAGGTGGRAPVTLQSIYAL